jgi:hypothetical protein
MVKKNDANQAQPTQAADAGNDDDVSGLAAKLRACADQLEAPAPAGAQTGLRDRLRPLLELALEVLPKLIARL